MFIAAPLTLFLTPAGVEQETVAKTRKLLEIKLGSLQPPEPQLPKPTASAPAAGGKTNGLREVTKGPMFRKYFQTGDDDDEGPAGQAEPEGPLGDGGLAPEELWSEVSRVTELVLNRRAYLGDGTCVIAAVSR